MIWALAHITLVGDIGLHPLYTKCVYFITPHISQIYKFSYFCYLLYFLASPTLTLMH